MRINLIPPEERRSPRPARLELLLAVVVALAAGVVVGTAQWNQHQLTEASRRVEALRQAVARLKPYQERLAQVREETQRLEKALEVMESGLGRGGDGPSLSQQMQRVAQAARRSGTVWLTRLSASQGRLQLEGFAGDPSSVTSFLTDLTAAGWLEQTQGGMNPVDAVQAGGDAGLSGGSPVRLVRFWGELRVSGVTEAGTTNRGTR